MTSRLPRSGSDLVRCDAEETARRLDLRPLMAAVAQAALDVDAGRLLSPERLVVPLGAGGVMLSMPATAPDIGIHKLVNVQPANRPLGLPTIFGLVTVVDAATGRPLCLLDGPEVTGRRTAAVSLVAIERLLGRAPAQVLLVGTGAQARHHLRALREVHPACRAWVRGRDRAAAERFCVDLRATHEGAAPCAEGVPDGVEAVILLTTSTEPVFDEPGRAGRVVVGVGAFRPGMAEIGQRTLETSRLYADDPAGARHEAGDLLRAGVDWARVESLGRLLLAPPGDDGPAVFKSVGSAAWDLAAARVALRALGIGP